MVVKEKSKEDKRGYTITLSQSGSALINSLENQIEMILEEFIDSVDPGVKQNLINILETINWKASCFINEL